jgi:hypothetical protein
MQRASPYTGLLPLTRRRVTGEHALLVTQAPRLRGKEATMRRVSCGLATSVMSVIALAGAPAEPQLAVFVVIENHAGVPRHVLARAIQTVADVYRPLGVGIAWIRAPFPAGDTPTLYLSLLARTGGGEHRTSMVGIDAPAIRDAPTHLGHILYRRIGDDDESSRALGYVMAHLVRGVLLSHDALDRPTIVRADRQTARRMAEGATVFTREEVKAIQDRVAAGAR